jgi:hypothetical protein
MDKDTVSNTKQIAPDETDDCLLCPICKDLLMIPRLYSCGHNVCEECMILADKATEDDGTHVAPIYRCPICRDETLQKWYARPINTDLIDVLCKLSPEYQTKHSEHEKRNIADVPCSLIPKNVNLGYLSTHIREFRTESLYRQIVPILYRAALEGKAYITITSSQAIGTVADLLAKRLIERNGIYRFISGHRECQIELVPSDRSYRCDFENEHYNTHIPIIDNANSYQEDEPDNDSMRSDLLRSLQTSASRSDNEPVSVEDPTGTGSFDRESRELSTFLVNHILRNLTQTREPSTS